MGSRTRKRIIFGSVEFCLLSGALDNETANRKMRFMLNDLAASLLSFQVYRDALDFDIENINADSQKLNRPSSLPFQRKEHEKPHQRLF